MRKAGIHIIGILLSVTVILIAVRCNSDGLNDVFYHEDELLISDYLELHEENYSSLLEVLDITGMKAALNAYGHYTFFVPDNSAFEKFVSDYGHNSLSDFDTEFLKSLVRFHLIGKEIETSYLPDGVLSDTTYSGDNLVFDFGEGGLNNIQINGESQIVERDIRVSNGYINRLNTVLDPVFLSVYAKLEALGNYNIFTNALLATGFSDTLSNIYVPLNSQTNIKTRFTMLCETDDVFSQAGIHSLEDLVNRFSDSEDLTDRHNALNRFMAYHCLPDMLYLNLLDSFNYNTLAPNKLINVKLTGEFLLNAEPDGQSVKIVPALSNKSAKNGVIHTINNVLIPYDPEPVYFVFDFTSYQGIDLGKSYTHEELEGIKGITTESTGLIYRMSILDEDSSYLETTTSNIGWTVEFKIPPVVKGRYRIRLHWVSDSDRSENVQTFWDDAVFGPVFTMRQHKRPPMTPPEWLYDFRATFDIGTVILDEAKPHKIKFFGLTEGLGEFDYLSFWPE